MATKIRLCGVSWSISVPPERPAPTLSSGRVDAGSVEAQPGAIGTVQLELYAAVGWGHAGAVGTSTKPEGREGTGSACAGLAICFLRSSGRKPQMLGHAAVGQDRAKATA